MREERHTGMRSARRHRRRSRRRREQEDVDLELMTPEERVLFEARERAERKVELTGVLVRYGIVGMVLMALFPFAGAIVLLVALLKFGREIYDVLIEPRVRERFLRGEVEKRVRAELVHERQNLEGEHARSMQELSASIAHEIRNPITAAKSLVQQMEEEPGATENVEYARVALAELSRVERSVSHLLRFARDEEVRRVPIRLAEVLDSSVETFRDRAERAGVQIACELDTEGSMQGDAEKLRRVVINLVGNALDALEEDEKPGGRVDVQLGENLAGTEVWLRVADDGPGIDDATRERLWSPFYTSKETGTGLGLPICKKLVDAHGGSIEVRSQPGHGTEFLLTFAKHVGEEVPS